MIKDEFDFGRSVTRYNLDTELAKILNNYMKIFDEYYSGNTSQDCAYLKDLVDSLLGISAVLEVYGRDKKIHPAYALEKLKYSKSIIEQTIKYYESELDMLEKIEGNEE